MVYESGVAEMLMKIAMFVLVQALVYLILTSSSNVFSSDKLKKMSSFKYSPSLSVRRFIAAVSDMPAGGEPSPTTAVATSLSSKPSLNEKLMRQESSASSY